MKKIIVSVFVIAVAVYISGCSKNNISIRRSVMNTDVNKINCTTDNRQPQTEDFLNIAATNKIIIYNLSRDDFQDFINEPTEEMIYENCIRQNTYSESGVFHITSNALFLQIQDPLLSLLGDEDNLQNYLSESAITDKIIGTAIVDSPSFPLTVWIETENTNYFITVELPDYTQEYEYTLYDHTAFLEKYRIKEGRLYLNSQEIHLKSPIKIFSKNADIPLLTVMQELGASVEWQNSHIAIVTYNANAYFLDLESPLFCRLGDNNLNILYQIDGGASIIYAEGTELWLDWVTLKHVLNEIGVAVNIIIDNAIVSIEVRNNGTFCKTGDGLCEP